MSSPVLRTIASTSTQALVVISPATITTPVLTSVSQATRPRGSASMIASRIASEIWSATLSGCPSETDSDVKEKLVLMSLKSWLHVAKIVVKASPEFGRRKLVVLRPTRLDLDRAHQRGHPAGCLPIETLEQAVN